MANSNFRTLQVDYLAGINANRSYIRNGLALQGTTGYATYADTGDRPVDGIGGVANVTWTVTTTNPLRGESSFLFTKDAANRQGQGASYAFAIDSADQAKVMQISFDYAIASGTYATGDLTCYIVDVTNGTVIQPSAFQIENVGVNSTARLTFQTASNSTSYRLCFHVASTSASAYSLKFDNIILGPQVVPMGAPVTDWVSYTPTSSWVAGVGTITGKWRRVGDTMEISGRVPVTGTPTTATLTISLPSGYVIDFTKLGGATTVEALGIGYAYDDNVNTRYVLNVKAASSTTLSFGPNAAIQVTQASPFTWAVNDNLEFMAQVPIVGWSSSTVVSSSADTRVVALNATSSTTVFGSILNGAVTTCIFQTSVTDTHGGYNSATGEYTNKVPGYYNISGTVRPSGTFASSAQLETMIYINGTKVLGELGELSGGSGNTMSPTVTLLGRWLNAGDVVTIRVVGSNWISLTCASGAGMHYFSISSAQGPSQIAASEVIAVNAYRSSTPQTIPNNSDTTIIFDVKEVDTHNAYNNTTGVFTAPAPGLYKFDAGVKLDLNIGTATNTYAYFQKQGNGVRAQTYQYQDVTAGDVTLRPSDIIPLDTGQTVTVRAAQFSGGSGATSAIVWQTYLNIHRLGGVM